MAGDDVRAEQDGVEFVRITMRRELAPSDLRSILALWRFFRTRRFAFVQTHTPKASMLALPAARLAGQRTIYTMHGSMWFRGNGRVANLAGWAFERWCCSWAHLVSMQSAEDTEVLPIVRICPKRKVRLQGNGIDMDRFAVPVRSADASAESGRRVLPVVLNISRLVAEKGCLDFFALAERLAGRGEFVHVGPTESDQKDAVDPAVVDDLRRRRIVRFVGELSDVRPELFSADLFVLPSFREGIPRACMEAAACGVAVVAYDVRGVREVVPAGLGLLAPRGDLDGLVAIVERLLADPQARAAAARACAEHVRAAFDERSVVDRIPGN